MKAITYVNALGTEFTVGEIPAELAARAEAGTTPSSTASPSSTTS